MNLLKVLLNNLKISNAGVTMIELVMVIAIVGILTVTGFTSYRNWQQHVLLTNATDELKSALNLAQTQAIAAAQSNNWGVHLATSSYIIFPGSFYDENNPNNKSSDLRGIIITNLDTGLVDGAGGFTRDAVFNKYTGNTANTGSLILAPASKPDYTKTISIDSNGQTQ